MLGSDYRELIVPKLDNRAQSTGYLIGGIALTAVSVVLALWLGRPLLLLLSAALGFLTWYLVFTSRIEYEYIISGDELTVTKILSQSKRKPMLTVSITKFTAFKSLQDAEQTGAAQQGGEDGGEAQQGGEEGGAEAGAEGGEEGAEE